MITIINDKQSEAFLSGKEYYKGKKIFTKIIMHITKRLRCYHALKHIKNPFRYWLWRWFLS
ncbi:MAG: hypothetical protein ACD_79C01437G0003 [uncultured bacterium]|nr:MAG: hypothetical protein ACD_79C01437G0003 [uncultured bacterium]